MCVRMMMMTWCA